MCGAEESGRGETSADGIVFDTAAFDLFYRTKYVPLINRY